MAPVALECATDLPESPLPGIEPLLTVKQLLSWTGLSLSYIYQYSNREEDPFPIIGTARARRALPSAVIAWMERNKGVAE